MARQSKTELAFECGQIIKGMNEQFANQATFTLAGKDYARAELIALFQRLVDAADARRLAKGKYTEAVLKEAVAARAVRPLRNAYKDWAGVMLGKTSPKMDLIGFKATKVPQVKVETKAAAVEKRKATRKARGTMGKKQRKAIKGKIDEEKKKEEKP